MPENDHCNQNISLQTQSVSVLRATDAKDEKQERKFTAVTDDRSSATRA
jgi:hypothetical protein